MNLPFPVRLFLAALASLALASALWVLLYATDLAFAVWEGLRSLPLLVQFSYAAVILALMGGFTWLVWRLLRPRKPSPARPLPVPLDDRALEARIAEAERRGANTGEARAELATLSERRTGEQVFIALFGESSGGKSSLIRALLPGCEAVIDVRRGTTKTLTRYAWNRPDGTPILLTDLPGLNVTAGGDETAWREEALRAHVVIYLTEGDLTRDQYLELQHLARFQKPVILALNKIDHYTRDQREALSMRLATRVAPLGAIDIVAISAGGMRPVVKVRADGREELASAAVPIEIDALVRSLDRILRRGTTAISASRDLAVWRLAAHKLDRAIVVRREAHAQEIIDDYTRKAVLGAVVAISPGTDLLIQGYLGIGLVRALCQAYDVSPREVDVSRFLKLASDQVRKTLPLVLTVAGNVCKAFPGVGTLAGGLLHAVGYGIIFESLGRAIAATLAEHGALIVSPALRAFEDKITDDLEARARRLVALAQERKS